LKPGALKPGALKPGLWVRLVRFVMLAPDTRQHCRCQAGNPLIGLSEFPEPPHEQAANNPDI